MYDLDIWKQREEARQQMELSNQDLTDVEDVTKKEGCLSFHQASLQRYILYCAQNISAGGLRGENFFFSLWNVMYIYICMDNVL